MEKNEKIHLLVAVILALCCTLWFVASASAAAFVVREKGKVYIVDQTGERWDVTQAESIGFKPEKFQYGMGRNFFTPLDDSHLTDNAGNDNSKLRVIGIAEGSEAKAFSVPKLSRHEVANSKIGDKPVAVGY